MRAVSDEQDSLVDWFEVEGVPVSARSISGFNWMLLVPLVAVAIVSYGTWAALKGQKKNRRAEPVADVEPAIDAPDTPQT